MATQIRDKSISCSVKALPIIHPNVIVTQFEFKIEQERGQTTQPNRNIGNIQCMESTM
jgi:hypothetical protein